MMPSRSTHAAGKRCVFRTRWLEWPASPINFISTGVWSIQQVLPCHTTPEAGGDFPSYWVPKRINAKEMFALREALQQVCVTPLGSLQRAPVVLHVGAYSVLHAFLQKRAKDSSLVVDKILYLQVQPCVLAGTAAGADSPRRRS